MRKPINNKQRNKRRVLFHVEIYLTICEISSFTLVHFLYSETFKMNIQVFI